MNCRKTEAILSKKGAYLAETCVEALHTVLTPWITSLPKHDCIYISYLIWWRWIEKSIYIEYWSLKTKQNYGLWGEHVPGRGFYYSASPSSLLPPPSSPLMIPSDSVTRMAPSTKTNTEKKELSSIRAAIITPKTVSERLQVKKTSTTVEMQKKKKGIDRGVLRDLQVVTRVWQIERWHESVSVWNACLLRQF